MSESWLYGWKMVAKFIGCSLRTAKTYHYRFGMPLLRAPNGKIIGIPDQITGWLIKFNEKCTKIALKRHSNIHKLSRQNDLTSK